MGGGQGLDPDQNANDVLVNTPGIRRHNETGVVQLTLKTCIMVYNSIIETLVRVT